MHRDGQMYLRTETDVSMHRGPDRHMHIYMHPPRSAARLLSPPTAAMRGEYLSGKGRYR